VKLPYRSGDSFELPLGDGTFVHATISACHHHVVDITVADRALRVFDDALVLHRWHACKGEPHQGHPEHVEGPPVGPAHAERIVATWRSVAAFDDSPIAVYEMHDGVTDEWLASLPHAAWLAWSRPLEAGALAHLRTYAESTCSTRLRLHGPAAAQLDAFAGAPIHELALAGPFHTSLTFANVRELTLDTPFDGHDLAQTFPNLRTLRIAAGAKRVDLSALGGLARLEVLDCSHVGLAQSDLEPLAGLQTLRALRLARVDGLHVLRGLERMPALYALAIEHQHLDSLAPLPSCVSLVQLELQGMWQYTIDELAWLHALPRLVRADVDIGGRRKNLELYRRGRWAYPWPVFSAGGAKLIERLE
jgi:hypothetical protein